MDMVGCRCRVGVARVMLSTRRGVASGEGVVVGELGVVIGEDDEQSLITIFRDFFIFYSFCLILFEIEKGKRQRRI